MKILIGSKALAQRINIYRVPGDIDYFSNEKIDKSECFYHPKLEEYDWSGSVANLDELYTIKVSHIFWDLRNNSWLKHFNDIMLMKEENAKLIPELYKLLYSIWEEIHGKKPANLNKVPEEFFNNQVKRYYEHDSIHASIAYFNEPLFNKILRDNHEVAVSKEKFDNLPHNEKIMLIREEIYATALERYVIPKLGYIDKANNLTKITLKNKSYSFYQESLKKIITSYSKGWFALFIVEHALELKIPDDYIGKFYHNSYKLVPLI